jgi:hypothetical protein
MAKPTMVKILTMSKMNLVEINMSEIIMVKIKVFKINNNFKLIMSI